MASLPQFQHEERFAAGDAARLAQLAAGLDAGFLRSGETLARALEVIRALMGGLDDTLDPVATRNAIGNLRCAAQQIDNLPQTLRERDAEMAKVTELTSELVGYVHDIQRVLRMLGVYGINIKITGAWGEFGIFVDNMNRRLQIGDGEVAGFSGRLAIIDDSIARMRSSDHALLMAKGRLGVQASERLADCSDQFEEQLSSAEGVSARLRGIAGQIEQAVGSVLAAIQVADSTRQRIEHVVSGLEMLSEQRAAGPLPQGVEASVARILAAQLDAITIAYRRESDGMKASMARLSSASGELLELVGQRVDDGGRASLGELEACVREVAQMTGHLRETASKSVEMAAMIGEALGGLISRLDSFDQIMRDVKEIAINTRLLCRDQGPHGQAVAVISMEVASQARHLQDTVNHIAVAVQRLETLNSSLHLQDEPAGQQQLGTVLDDALAAISAADAYNSSALAQGFERSHELISLLTDAANPNGDDALLQQTLSQVAQSLHQPHANLDSDGEAWLAAFLPGVHALYTMAEERAIHTQNLPANLQFAIVTPHQAASTNDDGLF